jgi:hypothetical protein
VDATPRAQRSPSHFFAVTNASSPVRLNQQRVDEQRYLRGPGWWIGVLISKTSVPVARAVWGAMSVGICALGIASIVLLHQR